MVLCWGKTLAKYGFEIRKIITIGGNRPRLRHAPFIPLHADIKNYSWKSLNFSKSRVQCWKLGNLENSQNSTFPDFFEKFFQRWNKPRGKSYRCQLCFSPQIHDKSEYFCVFWGALQASIEPLNTKAWLKIRIQCLRTRSLYSDQRREKG